MFIVISWFGSWSLGRHDLLPERPTDYVGSRAITIPIPRPPKTRRDPDLARGVWAEGAAEDVPQGELFNVLRLHAGPLHRRFAELDCREIGESAPKAAERRPDAAGEVDFLEHCFIAKGVLIGSSNYFTAGPKRSTSSFHEATILELVFRAL